MYDEYETPTMERIAKGVALLDDKRPNWRRHIDVDGLDLGSPRHCILGQLYKNDATEGEDGFHIGTRKLGIDHDRLSTEYGFDINDEDSYADLQREWLKVLGDDSE